MKRKTNKRKTYLDKVSDRLVDIHEQTERQKQIAIDKSLLDIFDEDNDDGEAS